MHLVKFSKRGVFKAPDTLVVTLILIISFALLFGTNSRPAYSLLICTASLSVLGFLYLSASNLTKNVFSDVAVKLYMLYVTSAFLVSIGFSNQNYNEGLRSALVLVGYGAMYIISSLLSQKEKTNNLKGIYTTFLIILKHFDLLFNINKLSLYVTNSSS